jgi:hypothetical protein
MLTLLYMRPKRYAVFAVKSTTFLDLTKLPENAANCILQSLDARPHLWQRLMPISFSLEADMTKLTG